MYIENGTRQSTRDFQQQAEPAVAAIAQLSFELISYGRERYKGM